MILLGTKVYLKPLQQIDTERWLEVQIKNKSFFEKYVATRSEAYYTYPAQEKIILENLEMMKKDEKYSFGIFEKETDILIGNVTFMEVARGPVQSAMLGYYLDLDYNGKGYMSEVVQLMVRFGFQELKLHRIDAGVMPRNPGSMRVLEKAGFIKEGIARKNVLINGQWEDHQMLAILETDRPFMDLEQLERMGQWVRTYGRLVDQAKWAHVLGLGSKDEVVKAMVVYQNPDGGFGNGFESDMLMPESSAIASAEAIFTAYDHQLDCHAPWFANCLSYFEKSVQETPSFWVKVPESIEAYPHAPWWTYTGDLAFSPNPCAIVAGAMLVYGTESQKVLGNKVAEKCIAFLNSDKVCSLHDFYCIQRLYKDLVKVDSPLITETTISAMKRRLLENVCYNEQEWSGYVAQPLDLIESPKEPFSELLAEVIEKNIAYWLTHLNIEGVWQPNFSWGIDSDIARQVTENWKGYMAVKRVRILKNFGRI